MNISINELCHIVTRIINFGELLNQVNNNYVNQYTTLIEHFNQLQNQSLDLLQAINSRLLENNNRSEQETIETID